MQIFKVTTLPGTYEPNAMYIVNAGTSSAQIFVANASGTGVRDITTTVNTDFTTYTLGVGTSTGSMDLKTAQVFTIANSTTGVRSMALTNLPAAGRAMTCVVRVVGNTGTVALPSGAKVADGADTTLGTTSTIFVMLVVGSEVTVTTNLRINN